MYRSNAINMRINESTTASQWTRCICAKQARKDIFPPSNQYLAINLGKVAVSKRKSENAKLAIRMYMGSCSFSFRIITMKTAPLVINIMLYIINKQNDISIWNF